MRVLAKAVLSGLLALAAFQASAQEGAPHILLYAINPSLWSSVDTIDLFTATADLDK